MNQDVEIGGQYYFRSSREDWFAPFFGEVVRLEPYNGRPIIWVQEYSDGCPVRYMTGALRGIWGADIVAVPVASAAP